MSLLADLSLARIQYSLPQFPGASVAEQLEVGKLAAGQALKSHLPDFQFDVARSEQVMRTVDAWAQRNAAGLQQAMGDPAVDTLPEQLKTSLGSAEQLRDFLVASYTLAASGMGPWRAGEVDRVVAAGQQPAEWARADAASRLQAFGIIVKLERDGQLGPMLGGQRGTAGLGALPLVAIMIVSVIFAAIVITVLYLNHRTDVNNRLMRDLCERAQAEGRQDVVKACIEATRDLQSESLVSGLGGLVAKVALVGALVYVGGRYVLPYLVDRAGRGARA